MRKPKSIFEVLSKTSLTAKVYLLNIQTKQWFTYHHKICDIKLHYKKKII